MTNEEIATQLNPNNPYLSISRKANEVKFYIDGSKNDALTLIQEAKERIAIFVDQLYNEINRKLVAGFHP